MVGRPGHSLVELIVALTLLGGSLVAMSATTLLSVRRTRDAVHLQEATGLATALMDSLLAGPDPRPGISRGAWGSIIWEVDEAATGRVVRMRVGVAPDGRTTAELHGLWIPPAPAAPGPAS